MISLRRVTAIEISLHHQILRLSIYLLVPGDHYVIRSEVDPNYVVYKVPHRAITHLVARVAVSLEIRDDRGHQPRALTAHDVVEVGGAAVRSQWKVRWVTI